ncbi:MAG TPA: FAD:protein FMN transferase [Blastocatellia bacterium]|nr:FAD:protein FMN transferase [Blastocatellia bacterium]
MIARACHITTCLALTILTGYASLPSYARFEFSESHMGTRFSIILYSRDGETAKRASRAAFECIGRLDAIMSDYRETSELTKVSREAHGRWVKVSDDLYRVLETSQKLAVETRGAFDITIGPVVRLWRHARRTGRMPDAERLERARRLVGYDKLYLDERTRSVRLDKQGMLLDLGGIAKGYAADQALDVLRRYGIRRALVAAGGDIAVNDPPPGKRGWAIAVAPLETSAGPPLQHLLLSNRAVSTSGDREQYVEIDGIRYSHIVDPESAYGVKGSGSVTVVAGDCTTSDSLATAVSVLGPLRGVKLIDSKEGASALIVQTTGDGPRVIESHRWKLVPKAGAKGVE